MPADPSHLDRVRAQFARQARPYAEMRQARDEATLAALATLAGAGPGVRVLDVACGPGFLTLAFAARGAEAVGLDATRELLALAREEAERRAQGRVRFVSGRAEATGFDDASFDVVSCRAAFHHFPEPARVLAEMRRVARPGGRLLVADLLGSEDPRKAALHDRIERLCDPSHARALPRSELDRLFADAGLAVRFARETELGYELEEWLPHGGPGPEATAEIRALLEGSMADDGADLAVRRRGVRLHFRHRAAVFLLER